MINRQKAILQLVSNEGGRVGKTRLFKLAFVGSYDADAQANNVAYEFVPYHFGPYSFTLAHELKTLERDGYLRIMDSEIKLVETAGLFPQPTTAVRSWIDSLSRRYKAVSTDDLVSLVYKRYPWYTSLARDKRKREAELVDASPAVYTVGYEGMMLDGFLSLLLKNGIKQLLDVRANPVARRFGFHKSTLKRHCDDVGINYLHFPELGISSVDRSELDDKASYLRLFDQYDTRIERSGEQYVKEVSELMCSIPSALMCMEADAKFCHRTRLASFVSSASKLRVEELRDCET